MIGYGYIYGGRYVSSGAGFTNTYSMLGDGVDEYFSLSGTPSAISSTQNFSFSCWFKGGTASDAFIGFNTSSTQRLFYGISSNSTNVILRAYLGIGVNVLTTATTGPAFNANTWYHAVLVYDGTQAVNNDRIRLYIDGSDVTGTPSGTIGTTTAASYSTNYLMSTAVTGQPMAGKIDELAIFDYSLTSTQVGYIYNSGVPTDLNNTSGLTAPANYWRMGDGATWGGSSWSMPDVGTDGTMTATSVNMEEADRVTDVP